MRFVRTGTHFKYLHYQSRCTAASFWVALSHVYWLESRVLFLTPPPQVVRVIFQGNFPSCISRHSPSIKASWVPSTAISVECSLEWYYTSVIALCAHHKSLRASLVLSMSNHLMRFISNSLGIPALQQKSSKGKCQQEAAELEFRCRSDIIRPRAKVYILLSLCHPGCSATIEQMSLVSSVLRLNSQAHGSPIWIESMVPGE